MYQPNNNAADPNDQANNYWDQNYATGYQPNNIAVPNQANYWEYNGATAPSSQEHNQGQGPSSYQTVNNAAPDPASYQTQRSGNSQSSSAKERITQPGTVYIGGPPPIAPSPEVSAREQILEVGVSRISSYAKIIQEVGLGMYQKIEADATISEVNRFYDTCRNFGMGMDDLLREASEQGLAKDKNTEQLQCAKIISMEEMSKYFLKALSIYLFTTVNACDLIKDQLESLLTRLVRLLNYYMCSGAPSEHETNFQSILAIIERKIASCRFPMSTIIFLWKLIQLLPADLKPDEDLILYEHVNTGFEGFSTLLNKHLVEVARMVASNDRKDPVPPDDAASQNYSFVKDMEYAEYFLNVPEPIVIPNSEIVHQNQREAACLGYRIPIPRLKLPGAMEISDGFDPEV